MTTLSFTYTKASGSTSDRVLVVIKAPNTMYEGLDISELSQEQQGEFITSYESLKVKYLSALDALKSEFDLVHSYRRFDPTKMTDIATE